MLDAEEREIGEEDLHPKTPYPLLASPGVLDPYELCCPPPLPLEFDSPEKSIFLLSSSYLENKRVHFVPWLLNFNGFCEKLICRIMALLSRGFPLSEPQTLGSPAGSVNEE